MTTQVSALTPLGDSILNVIKMFRHATPKLLERYLGKSANQIKNELRNLRNAGLIEAFSFFGNQKYIRLTNAGCSLICVSRSYAGALGPQSLYQHYGLLHFACHLKVNRPLLSDDELSDWLEADASSLEGNFYLDHETDDGQMVTRLGNIVIDSGLDPATLLKKASSFVKRRKNHAAFRECATSGRLLFCFVTVSEGKADAIEAAVRQHKFAFSCRLHVCSDLQQL